MARALGLLGLAVAVVAPPAVKEHHLLQRGGGQQHAVGGRGQGGASALLKAVSKVACALGLLGRQDTLF